MITVGALARAGRSSPASCHGGRGVREGSVVERLGREVRALRIVEWTTEIQRVVMSPGLLEKL